MKYGFVMLSLKQTLSQSSGNELVLHLPKKFKLSPSAGKVRLVAFWDTHGKILAHFRLKVELTARYYSEVILGKKNESSPEKCPLQVPIVVPPLCTAQTLPPLTFVCFQN